MMRSKLLLSVLTTLLLGLPVAHAQYMEPEEVINFEISGKGRNAQQTAEKQSEPTSLQQQRPVFQEWWLKDSASSAGVAGSVSSTANHSGPPVGSYIEPDEEEEDTPIDPTTERLLRRLETAENAWGLGGSPALQNPWIMPEGNTLQSTALHSGAPLAPTGPAATATVVLLMGTIAWILWRSKGMKQFLAQ